MKKTGTPLGQKSEDKTPRFSFLAAGRVLLVLLVLFGLGSAIGTGFFGQRPSRDTSAAAAGGRDPEAGAQKYAIQGTMKEERRDGLQWQSMNLFGEFGEELDGSVHMTVHEESAAVLRARFDAEARRDGWEKLENGNDSDRIGFYHNNGRVRIVSIEEFSPNFRSVAIFDGSLTKRD